MDVVEAYEGREEQRYIAVHQLLKKYMKNQSTDTQKESAADPSQEPPQLAELSQEPPQSVDSSQEPPQSVDSSQEPPQPVDLSQDQTAVDSSQESPAADVPPQEELVQTPEPLPTRISQVYKKQILWLNLYTSNKQGVRELVKNSRQWATNAFKGLRERVTRSDKKKQQERSGFRNEEEEKENQRLGQVEDELIENVLVPSLTN